MSSVSSTSSSASSSARSFTSAVSLPPMPSLEELASKAARVAVSSLSLTGANSALLLPFLAASHSGGSFSPLISATSTARKSAEESLKRSSQLTRASSKVKETHPSTFTSSSSSSNSSAASAVAAERAAMASSSQQAHMTAPIPPTMDGMLVYRRIQGKNTLNRNATVVNILNKLGVDTRITEVEAELRKMLQEPLKKGEEDIEVEVSIGRREKDRQKHLVKRSSLKEFLKKEPRGCLILSQTVTEARAQIKAPKVTVIQKRVPPLTLTSASSSSTFNAAGAEAAEQMAKAVSVAPSRKRKRAAGSSEGEPKYVKVSQEAPPLVTTATLESSTQTQSASLHASTGSASSAPFELPFPDLPDSSELSHLQTESLSSLFS